MNAFLVRPLPIAAYIGSSTPRTGTISNIGNDYAGIIFEAFADNGASSNAAYFNVDLGADVEIDTIMLFGVNGVPLGATGRVAYATSAQGPLTGSVTTYDVPQVWAGSQPPATGRIIGMMNPGAIFVARYVQVAITLLGTGGAVTLSRIVIGKRFTPSRNFSFGGNVGVRDFGSLDFSDRAALLRRTGLKLRTVGLPFNSVYKDEVEAQVEPLLEYLGNTGCVALCTDPAPNAMRQRRCYYGPLLGDLSVTRRNAVGWEWRANMVSLF